MGEVVASIEALGAEVVEADPLAGPTRHRQQRGHPGEELQVHHSGHSPVAAPAPEAHEAFGHVDQTRVREAEDVRLVEEPEEPQRRDVLLEDHEAGLLTRQRARSLDRRGREDGAAHLGKLHEQNATWIPLLPLGLQAVDHARPGAREQAQGTPDEGVDATHGGQVHGAPRIRSSAVWTHVPHSNSEEGGTPSRLSNRPAPGR